MRPIVTTALQGLDPERENRPAESVRRLFEAAIDYAGLFPPAALPMRDTVEEYAAGRAGCSAWMLGRLVCPASRLEELSRALDEATGIPAAPWRVSALAGPNLEADVEALARFNVRHAGREARVDSIEVKLQRPDDVVAAWRRIPSGIIGVYEIPLSESVEDWLATVRESGGLAKIRTGGVAAGQFPSSASLAHFMTRAISLNVAFKATAGLHHAIRGSYALGDEPAVAMHGFINLLMAVALGRAGIGEHATAAVLEECDPAAFRFETDGAWWRERYLLNRQLAEARQSSIRSWGSCSFTEPLEELRALHLL